MTEYRIPPGLTEQLLTALFRGGFKRRWKYPLDDEARTVLSGRDSRKRDGYSIQNPTNWGRAELADTCVDASKNNGDGIAVCVTFVGGVEGSAAPIKLARAIVVETLGWTIRDVTVEGAYTQWIVYPPDYCYSEREARAATKAEAERRVREREEWVEIEASWAARDALRAYPHQDEQP